MARRKTRRKTTTKSRRRPRYRRRRSNPYVVTNRPKRRRYRRRRNPALPTKMFQQAITVAAGFLTAPMLTSMIPFELPGGKLGQYLKEFAVISIGSTLVTKTLGRKYGNALFAGGLIHIGVDALQSYVPAFGGNGLTAYFPPDSELRAMGYGNAVPSIPSLESGTVDRFSSRFA